MYSLPLYTAGNPFGKKRLPVLVPISELPPIHYQHGPVSYHIPITSPEHHSQAPSSASPPKKQPAPVHVHNVPAESDSPVCEHGLTNPFGENNCFVNVILQALWHIPKFASAFISRDDPHLHANNGCVFCALKVKLVVTIC